MKESRHNARTGKHGVFNPKHNDRNFDTNNSDHIDNERVLQNVYWDCYQGYRTGVGSDEGRMDFCEVESLFYKEHYGGFCEAQNQRNIANRHPERNRTTEDILKSPKTCPEETILQIGNISESIPGELLRQIAEEYYQRLDDMYGENFHVIDWSLHMDEGTPHIHERHVFDCKNSYGETAPQQEKALKVMGIELPQPDKKEGRFNNRKMTFDKECREMFAQIAASHGIFLDLTPTYGGREYMEKQDYIIAKQKGELAELSSELDIRQQKLDEVTMKISDVESFVKDISDEAYKQAVEFTTARAGEIVGQVTMNSIDFIDDNLRSNAERYTKNNVLFAGSVLKALRDKVREALSHIGTRIKEKLLEPATAKEAKTIIEEKAAKSIKTRLAMGKIKSDENSVHIKNIVRNREH